MPLFQYRALQADGLVAEGQLEAAGRQEAFRQMEGLGLRPVSLAEKAAAQAGGKSLALPESLSSIFKKSEKISARALENFTRLLSRLVSLCFCSRFSFRVFNWSSPDLAPRCRCPRKS